MTEVRIQGTRGTKPQTKQTKATTKRFQFAAVVRSDGNLAVQEVGHIGGIGDGAIAAVAAAAAVDVIAPSNLRLSVPARSCRGSVSDEFGPF